MEELKERALTAIDAIAGDLVAVSHEIHAHPELGYQEEFAAARLQGLLAQHGVDAEVGAYGVPTAFAGDVGSAGDGALVAICCEYDALPGIGHGCGHNIIAAAGAGAAIALAGVVDDAGGRLRVLGTPAEELNGGGKVRLLDAGAFRDVDVAMMVHPESGDVERVPYLATDTVDVVFHGRAAHASSSPHKGHNALDAVVAAYNAISMLRQQTQPDEKLHGIITDGGQAENIIPARAAARWKVRARDQQRLDRLKAKVVACFDGAALQTGCTYDATWAGGYTDLRANRALAAAYRRNGERLGRRFVDPALIPIHVAGSTDMGNVSKAVPSIHPALGAFPLGTPGHSEVLAGLAVAPDADRAAIDGAKALAMTAIDVWTDPGLLDAVRDEFAAFTARR
jgi:amidohydrolase